MRKLKQNIETRTETAWKFDSLLVSSTIFYYLAQLVSSICVCISFSWLLYWWCVWMCLIHHWGHAQYKLTPRLDAPAKRCRKPLESPWNPLGIPDPRSLTVRARLRFNEAKPRDWTSYEHVGTPVLHSNLGCERSQQMTQMIQMIQMMCHDLWCKCGRSECPSNRRRAATMAPASTRVNLVSTCVTSLARGSWWSWNHEIQLQGGPCHAPCHTCRTQAKGSAKPVPLDG